MGFFDFHEPEDGRDRFFLYAMIILPIVSSGSCLFDAWYHFAYHSEGRTYVGLLSTILIVFSYLQYFAPIQSRATLAVYHIFLWIISEIATLGYLIYYIKEHETLKIVVHCCFAVIESYFTAGLLYCRVWNQFESNIVVENKHLFHFMSRLEVILTIFIPIYMNTQFTSLTRNSIAFFLLFDFFSDSYARFQGVWIKSALYLFVATVTLTVATEWIYFNQHDEVYEEISLIAELVSAILCDTIIILQFFPFHFKTRHVQHIAREAMLFQQALNADFRASISLGAAAAAMHTGKDLTAVKSGSIGTEETNEDNMETNWSRM